MHFIINFTDILDKDHYAQDELIILLMNKFIQNFLKLTRD